MAWVSEYAQERNEYLRLTEKLIKENKSVLIAALSGTQIAKLTAPYSGGGDDGDFGEVSALDSEGKGNTLPGWSW
jgi:hypothetical protein